MEVTIRIENAKEIARAFAKSPEVMAKELQQAINKSALIIHKESANIVRTGKGYKKRPFKTGSLFRSFQTTISPLKAIVWPKVHYAIYPHEGWSTSKKYGRRPFMEDAVKSKKKEIDKIFNDHLKDGLNKIARSAK